LTESAHDIVRRYIDALNRADFEAAASLLDENVIVAPGSAWRWRGTEYRGREGWSSLIGQSGMRDRPYEFELEIHPMGPRVLASGSATRVEEDGTRTTRRGAMLFSVDERGIRRIDSYAAEAAARAALIDDKTRVLTAREREIFRLLAKGLNGPEIAEKLNLSANTVRTHVANGMAALKAKTRAHAVAEAIGRGELDI
jgi:DNA-binding CsgD family transcriptional regulator